MLCVDSVSYTHLDVYKRQMETTAKWISLCSAKATAKRAALCISIITGTFFKTQVTVFDQAVQFEKSLHDDLDRIAENEEAHKLSLIHILLIGAEDDVLWDTAKYIRRMKQRIKEHPHTCRLESVSYTHLDVYKRQVWGINDAYRKMDSSRSVYSRRI